MPLFLTREVIRGIILFLASGIIGLIVLLVGYQLLRTIKISPNWVTWIIGTFIMAGCITLCIWLFIPHASTGALPASNVPGSERSIAGRFGFLLTRFSNPRIFVNVLGAVSVVMGVYAAAQWLARQGFVAVKKRATTIFVQPARNFLLFIRKQHQFLGWLAVIAAATHMIGYLPTLFHNQQYEIVTGFIAIGILALMAILGTWIWVDNSLRKHNTPKLLKTIHASLTLVFFLLLILHI
ncbi:MAG TPA: hypothetical protein VL485_32965 [Ktedonobacteraceae bacterium]|jgi:hypothetical protein|nr:hypothetical protein [Ktedonobacteraceae bacterium]